MLKSGLQFSTMLLLATVFTGFSARAATPQLENANIEGQGGTLTITRMPIKTPSGTIYRDVVIQLQADDAGNVTFARGRLPATSGATIAGRAPAPANSPVTPPEPTVSGGGALTQTEPGLAEVQPLTVSPSKPVKVQQFKAGTYQGNDGSLVHVTGGGNALLEGVPVWTLTAIGGSGALTSAIWYEGLISDNPRERVIKRAGITSLDYAYGTSDQGDGGSFGSGALLGATQTGDTLTIVSYHHGCCSNGREPTASLTYKFIGR